MALNAPSATPNDPDYTYQYDMKNIGMPAAWATGQFGSPQVIQGMRAMPELDMTLWRSSTIEIAAVLMRR